MTEEKTKKRGWVKNAAIIFLAVLLVLTFFSNTIMNWSLPEVAVKTAESGSINAQIRGTGTVMPVETYDVIVDYSKQVQTVYAKVGEEVIAGDVLFVFKEGGSGELEEAKENLKSFQDAYTRALLQASTYDYTMEDRNIEKLREQVTKLTAERDGINLDSTALNEAKIEAAAALANLEKSQKNTEEHSEAVEKAQEKVDDLLAQASEIERKMSVLSAGGGDYSSVVNAREAYDQAKVELEKAQQLLEDAYNAYNAAVLIYGDKYNILVERAKDRIAADYNRTNTPPEGFENAFDALTDEEKQALYNQYLDTYIIECASEADPASEEYKAYVKLNEYVTGISAAERGVESAEQSLSQAKSYYSAVYDSYYEQNKDNVEFNKLSEELDEINENLKAAQESLAATKEGYRIAAAETATLQKAYDNATESLTKLEAQQAIYDDASEQLEFAQENLEDALFNLAQQKKNDNISKQLQELDLKAMREQIDEQKALVEKLSSGSTVTEVKSEINGVVTSVNVTSGNTTSPGMVLASIEVPDRGYTLQFQVTAEQAQRVTVGTEAEVSNGWWWGEEPIKATLMAIRPDPQNQRTNRYLVFNVTGDVDSGSSLTLAVGERSRSYDIIVPKSAMRSDSNGDFVFIVTAKQSPLGNRYTARRVDVTKLAEDDVNCAISGGVAYGDFIITTSTAPIENGMQVRLPDEN